MISTREIIETIQSTTSLPPIAMEMQTVLKDPNSDFRTISDKMKFDPGMVSKILSLVNSAYYGFRSEIVSLQNAIALIGIRKVYEFVLADSVSPMMKKQITGYDMSPGQLWKHSVAVGIGAEQLAKKLKIPSLDYIFTAGLLHNIGKIILGSFIDADTWPIIEIAFAQDISFDKAEKKVLGIDHAEAGALLLENWKLPKNLVMAARYHHQPMECPEEHVAVELIHIVDVILMQGGMAEGIDNMKYFIHPDIEKKYKIDEELKTFIIENVHEGLEELKTIFNI